MAQHSRDGGGRGGRERERDRDGGDDIIDSLKKLLFDFSGA